MRLFAASLATETNTFAPLPTSLASFKEGGYFSAGTHRDQMVLFAGPLWAERQRARELGWTLIGGLVASAQLGGTTTREACETLRDELLADLRAASPIDAVLRAQLDTPWLGIDEAIDAALVAQPGLVVIADSADNPGGGAAGDATFILRRLVERQVASAALSPLWNPQAVRITFDAGIDAALPMRLGRQDQPDVGRTAGRPVPTEDAAAQHADERPGGHRGVVGRLRAGRRARHQGGVDPPPQPSHGHRLVQPAGCDLASKRLVNVKSSQYFGAAFAPLAVQVTFASAPGSVTADLRQLPYRKIRRPKWPIDLRVLGLPILARALRVAQTLMSRSA